MGSEPSRINNCCSCLEQTQVGESVSQQSINTGYYSKKQNMISLQQGISIINDDASRPSQNINLILLGEKQCGKTTFVNQLKNKSSPSPLPTQYPSKELVKTYNGYSSKAIFLNEVDFDYYHSSQSRSLQKKIEGFIFVIKYSENKQNLLEQIRNFSRIDKKQSPCAILINLFTENSEENRKSIKQEVRDLLKQYSISACAIEFMSERSSKFLSDMSKIIEANQISQVK